MSKSHNPSNPRRYTYPNYHGTITKTELRKLTKPRKMEVMQTWFFENFEDPVHNTPWDEGAYVYIHGGPYDAQQELEAEFGSFISPEIIKELADELNNECTEWTKPPEYEPDERDYPVPPSQPIKAFKDSIEATLSLLETEVSDSNSQYFLRLLFANAISALETYLADFLISILSSEPWFLRRFIEKNQDFSDRKVPMNEIFTKVAQVEKEALSYLRDTIWHNLPKAKAIYKFTLKIEFPPIPELLKAVSVRHDIVHRSGKTKEGIEHTINKTQIRNLTAQALALVEEIEKQWGAQKKSALSPCAEELL